MRLHGHQTRGTRQNIQSRTDRRQEVHQSKPSLLCYSRHGGVVSMICKTREWNGAGTNLVSALVPRWRLSQQVRLSLVACRHVEDGIPPKLEIPALETASCDSVLYM